MTPIIENKLNKNKYCGFYWYPPHSSVSPGLQLLSWSQPKSLGCGRMRRDRGWIRIRWQMNAVQLKKLISKSWSFRIFWMLPLCERLLCRRERREKGKLLISNIFKLSILNCTNWENKNKFVRKDVKLIWKFNLHHFYVRLVIMSNVNKNQFLLLVVKLDSIWSEEVQSEN